MFTILAEVAIDSLSLLTAKGGDDADKVMK